jgi:hypothetical protein
MAHRAFWQTDSLLGNVEHFFARVFFSTSRWGRQIPPKRRFLQDARGATSQRTAFFIAWHSLLPQGSQGGHCLHLRLFFVSAIFDVAQGTTDLCPVCVAFAHAHREQWFDNWVPTWSRVLLETPQFVHLLKSILILFWTGKFIPLVTRARHWSLHRDKWTQSILPYPNLTLWPESVNELYRPSDRRLSAKLVSTFCG